MVSEVFYFIITINQNHFPIKIYKLNLKLAHWYSLFIINHINHLKNRLNFQTRPKLLQSISNDLLIYQKNPSLINLLLYSILIWVSLSHQETENIPDAPAFGLKPDFFQRRTLFRSRVKLSPTLLQRTCFAQLLCLSLVLLLFHFWSQSEID